MESQQEAHGNGLLPTPPNSEKLNKQTGLLPTPPKSEKLKQPKPILFIGSKPSKPSPKQSASTQSSVCVPKPSPKQSASTKGKEVSAPSSLHVDVDNLDASQKEQMPQEKDWEVAPGDGWDVDQASAHGEKYDRHGRIAGDLAMAQARLTGSRRRRPGTPSSSPNPSKFVRVADEESNEEAGSQDVLVGPAPSQDMLLSLPPSRRIDYETWDLKRYQHAITMEARRRFWSFASEPTKRRLTAELLQLSPSANTRKQASTMGWLPKATSEKSN